jgi:hypothetical protein
VYGGGHAGNEQEYSLMDRVADREIFVAVKLPTAQGYLANGSSRGMPAPRLKYIGFQLFLNFHGAALARAVTN